MKLGIYLKNKKREREREKKLAICVIKKNKSI
jgi:hypothetical protein